MLKLLSLAFFSSSLFAQTALTANQVKECPSALTSIVVVMAVPANVTTTTATGSTVTKQTMTTVCAAIDAAAFKLDTSTTPPTLRVVTAAPVVLPVFVDQETPGGTIDGVNASFTLANAPSPAASLQLFRNGVLQQAGAGGDYTISGVTITFNALSIPQPGDVLQASYRH
jgi:hypothetical protein